MRALIRLTGTLMISISLAGVFYLKFFQADKQNQVIIEDWIMFSIISLFGFILAIRFKKR